MASLGVVVLGGRNVRAAESEHHSFLLPSLALTMEMKKKHGMLREAAISSFKAAFGEHVTSVKWKYMVSELLLKATVYNTFLSARAYMTNWQGRTRRRGHARWTAERVIQQPSVECCVG